MTEASWQSMEPHRRRPCASRQPRRSRFEFPKQCAHRGSYGSYRRCKRPGLYQGRHCLIKTYKSRLLSAPFFAAQRIQLFFLGGSDITVQGPWPWWPDIFAGSPHYFWSEFSWTASIAASVTLPFVRRHHPEELHATGVATAPLRGAPWNLGRTM